MSASILLGSVTCLLYSIVLSFTPAKLFIRLCNRLDHQLLPICHHIAIDPNSKSLLLGIEKNPFATGRSSIVFNPLDSGLYLEWYEISERQLLDWTILQNVQFYSNIEVFEKYPNAKSYLSRRNDALNSNFIFLKHFQTGEMIRIHVKTPVRKITTKISTLQELIYELQVGSRTYTANDTRDLTEFLFYPGHRTENQKLLKDALTRSVKN